MSLEAGRNELAVAETLLNAKGVHAVFVRRIVLMLLVSAALGLTVSADALADRDRLTRQEIVDLLAGNTAIGRHRGLAFREYFDEGGERYYKDARGNAEEGYWRVTEDGHYCASPSEGGWTCYTMEASGDSVMWRGTDDDTPIAAVIVSGNQLDAEGGED